VVYSRAARRAFPSFPTRRSSDLRALVPTGIAIALPEGYAGFVQPRSGLALKHGVTCLNTPGLIDAGYRDELKVLLINTDPTSPRSEEHTSELQSLRHLVCRLLLE